MKFDSKDPATWPNDYRQCSFCSFGSRKPKEVKKHLKEKHGKTVK